MDIGGGVCAAPFSYKFLKRLGLDGRFDRHFTAIAERYCALELSVLSNAFG